MQRRTSCRELVEFLADYLSGELPPEQRAVFDEHLATCPSCVSYTSTYVQVLRLGRAVMSGEDEPAPSEEPEELIQAVLASRKRIS